MLTGHEDRTRAVLEHARRMREKHTETRVEAIPKEVGAALLAMAEEIRSLKSDLAAERQRIDSILEAVEDANG